MNKKCIEQFFEQIDNIENYKGQYVCIENFNSKKIISNSVDANTAYLNAENNGFLDPVIFFVSYDDIQILSHEHIL